MRQKLWQAVRVLGGAAILAVLVWRLGTGPFLHGLRTVDAGALAIGATIALATTVCLAWRWSLVARGLGLRIGLGEAVAGYCRAQFLNMVLPGGVLGDVHRGVSHGRNVGSVGRGVRAVVWERLSGQVVQIALTALVLLVMPSPVRAWMPTIVAAVVAVVALLVLLARTVPAAGSSRWARGVRAARADLRDGVLDRRAWPGIVTASVLVMAGYTAIFLIAARTAGTTAPLARMVPIAMLVLVAMAVPVNVGGWGPREGVAAWAFGAAALGVDQGIAASVVYGVMVLVGSLPGAVVLVVAWRRGVSRRWSEVPDPDRPDSAELRPAARSREGAAHG